MSPLSLWGLQGLGLRLPVLHQMGPSRAARVCVSHLKALSCGGTAGPGAPTERWGKGGHWSLSLGLGELAPAQSTTCPTTPEAGPCLLWSCRSLWMLQKLRQRLQSSKAAFTRCDVWAWLGRCPGGNWWCPLWHPLGPRAPSCTHQVAGPHLGLWVGCRAFYRWGTVAG